MEQKRKNFNILLGTVLTGMVVLPAIIGIFVTPYDPEMMDSLNKLSGVSFTHIMGCDNFGRDIFSRIMVGSGVTLLIACGTVFLGVVMGTLIGAFTGYFGGLLDEIIMRVNDAVFAFPSILLALVIIGLFGSGRYQVMFALGIAFIPSYARIVRSEFIRCKNMDYVKCAKLAGASDFRIIFVHILPNTYSVLVSSIMIGFNNAVLAEAGLSFLGIGVQPPDASLGRMLSEAQTYLFSNPTYALFPGITIIMMVLGFALLGEGLKEH